MTQGEYPYPPDEFDAVDPSEGPRGAHRRPRSRWATTWPYLAVLAASAVLAYVVIGFVWDERDAAPTPAVGAPDATPAATPPASPEATPEPTGDAAPLPAPTGTVAPPAADETAAPDLGTPVAVLNSTSVTGLAADAAARLEDAGWTAVTPGNFTGGSLPASTVRYADPELEATARAVAEALGIAAVEPGGTDGVEVVLEADFAG